MTVNSQAEFLKSFGRFGDNYLAHVAGGERVLPPKGVLPENVDRDINRSMQDAGLNPDRYTVGSDANSINPVTGQPEFFLGSVLKSAFGGRKDTTAFQRAHAERSRRAYEDFDLTPGYYSDPFGTGTAERSGLSAQFSPDQQNIFDRYTSLFGEAEQNRRAREAQRRDLFGVDPSVLTGGRLDKLLTTSMEQGQRETDFATSNALSRLFNAGGMSSATAAQAGDFQRRQAKTFADLQRQRISDLMAVQGAYDQYGRAYDADIAGYGAEQGKMIDRLRFGPEAARLYSGELTNLDWERLQGQLGAEANIARALHERRAAKRSGWERFAPMLDLGTMVALGGYSGGNGFEMTGALKGAQQFAGSPMNTAGGGSPSTGNFLNNYNSLSPFFTGSRGGPDMYNPLQGNSNPGRRGLGTFYSRSMGPL